MAQTAVTVARRLAQENPIARMVLKELAEFKTAHQSTDIYRRWVNLRKLGQRVTKEQVEEVFVEFGRLGWGKVIRPRGQGEHGRINWNPGFDYRAVAQDALKDISVKAFDMLVERRTVETPAQGGPQVILTLLSGKEIRLTMAEARELRDQLAAL